MRNTQQKGQIIFIATTEAVGLDQNENKFDKSSTKRVDMTKTIGQKHKRKHRHGYTTEEHDKSGSENFALRWKQLRQIQLKRGKIAQSDCFVVIFYATQNYPLSKVECNPSHIFKFISTSTSPKLAIKSPLTSCLTVES